MPQRGRVSCGNSQAVFPGPGVCVCVCKNVPAHGLQHLSAVVTGIVPRLLLREITPTSCHWSPLSSNPKALLTPPWACSSSGSQSLRASRPLPQGGVGAGPPAAHLRWGTKGLEAAGDSLPRAAGPGVRPNPPPHPTQRGPLSRDSTLATGRLAAWEALRCPLVAEQLPYALLVPPPPPPRPWVPADCSSCRIQVWIRSLSTK